MAANMKAVKLRMKSIQSTMQITKAMELVASSKLRKAKERRCKPALFPHSGKHTGTDRCRQHRSFFCIYKEEQKRKMVLCSDRR